MNTLNKLNNHFKILEILKFKILKYKHQILNYNKEMNKLKYNKN